VRDVDIIIHPIKTEGLPDLAGRERRTIYDRLKYAVVSIRCVVGISLRTPPTHQPRGIARSEGRAPRPGCFPRIHFDRLYAILATDKNDSSHETNNASHLFTSFV
jgi:hypothetical protein